MHAKKLEQINRVTAYRPLDNTNFEEYYVNCSLSRGDTDVTKRLIQALRCSTDDPHASLFTGHKCCGKSTELVRLGRELKDDFLVITFSAQHDLDSNSLTYVDLVFEAMRQLYRTATEDLQLPLDAGLIENIHAWFSSITVTEVKEKNDELKIAVGLEAAAKIPLIGKLFTSVGGHLKYSGATREEIRTAFNRRFSELLLQCNMLIHDIAKRCGKPILIIVEDLDKLDLDRARAIFLNHGGQITALSCHMIFSFPISLRYCPDFSEIEGCFRTTYDLPMIKFTSAEGKQHLTDIIEKRLDTELLAAGILEQSIAKSGGSLRDLFRLLQTSASFAMEKDRSSITAADFARGVQEVKKSFEFSLSDRLEAGKVIVRDGEYFAKLAEVQAKKVTVAKDRVLMDLLHNRSVLLYQNGSSWYDVHPLVKEILDARDKATND